VNKKLVTLSFLVLEFLLFHLIHLNLTNFGVGLRYLSIVLCLIYVLIIGKTKDSKLIKIALVLTLCADLFLLIIDNYYCYGVSIFCFVQFIYTYRLLLINHSQRKLRVIIQIISIAAIEIGAKILLPDNFDLLALVTIIYFVSLLNNIVNSVVFAKMNPLFSLGLVLFGLCDIFVGLSNLGTYVDFSFFTSLDLAWLFYIPSQVLLALSISYKKKTCINNYASNHLI
jgi:hypothetical protein